jgi:hypothetical protein
MSWNPSSNPQNAEHAPREMNTSSNPQPSVPSQNPDFQPNKTGPRREEPEQRKKFKSVKIQQSWSDESDDSSSSSSPTIVPSKPFSQQKAVAPAEKIDAEEEQTLQRRVSEDNSRNDLTALEIQQIYDQGLVAPNRRDTGIHAEGDSIYDQAPFTTQLETQNSSLSNIRGAGITMDTISPVRYQKPFEGAQLDNNNPHPLDLRDTNMNTESKSKVIYYSFQENRRFPTDHFPMLEAQALISNSSFSKTTSKHL